MVAQELVDSLWCDRRIKFKLSIHFIVHHTFFKHGVVFPAILRQIQELVCYLFRGCVPDALQIAVILSDFDWDWFTAGQRLLQLLRKARIG